MIPVSLRREVVRIYPSAEHPPLTSGRSWRSSRRSKDGMGTFGNFRMGIGKSWETMGRPHGFSPKNGGSGGPADFPFKPVLGNLRSSHHMPSISHSSRTPNVEIQHWIRWMPPIHKSKLEPGHLTVAAGQHPPKEIPQINWSWVQNQEKKNKMVQIPPSPHT